MNIKTHSPEFNQTNNQDDFINGIVYGNPPKSLHIIANKPSDPIRDWFESKGINKKICQICPTNSGPATREDLKKLVEMTREATQTDITFANFVDKEDNVASLFVRLLSRDGFEETNKEFFEIDNQTLPLLYHLKEKINRPRPYQLAHYFGFKIYPLIRTDAMTSSFPSGHALMAFVMSEYYSLKYPDKRHNIERLAERIAKSREISGIHYPSDTEMSRVIAKLIFENKLISM